MSNRHLARSLVLQTLFQWDFNKKKEDPLEVLSRNQAEFAPGFEDLSFAKNLIKEIVSKREELDNLITTYAPEWPLDQITTVDRNVLRIGIYELRYTEDIPPKVAINEAIELAKNFSGQSSGKFVNGVLGTIFKKMQEIGEKDEFNQEVPKEFSGGGVVYCQDEKGSKKFVLVLDAYNKWTFPKGKIQADEPQDVAARREVAEEVGLIDLEVITYLGSIDIKVNEPGKRAVPKTVHYFLMKSSEQPLRLQPENKVQSAEWFSSSEAMEKVGYTNAQEILSKAYEYLEIDIKH